MRVWWILFGYGRVSVVNCMGSRYFLLKYGMVGISACLSLCIEKYVRLLMMMRNHRLPILECLCCNGYGWDWC